MTLFTYQNLYNAYLDCRKRKRNTANALKFEQNLEANLSQLFDDLRNRKYQTSTSISFIVEESVIREILEISLDGDLILDDKDTKREYALF